MNEISKSRWCTEWKGQCFSALRNPGAELPSIAYPRSIAAGFWTIFVTPWSTFDMCKFHDLITAVDSLHFDFLDEMAIFLEQTQNCGSTVPLSWRICPFDPKFRRTKFEVFNGVQIDHSGSHHWKVYPLHDLPSEKRCHMYTVGSESLAAIALDRFKII